jgi:hypothetical protein
MMMKRWVLIKVRVVTVKAIAVLVIPLKTSMLNLLLNYSVTMRMVLAERAVVVAAAVVVVVAAVVVAAVVVVVVMLRLVAT